MDGLLAPWVNRPVTDGVPADEMLEHDSAPKMLNAVAEWCGEYARRREESGLAFIEAYPVESLAGQVPSERRAAVPSRVAAMFSPGSDDA